MNALAQFTIYSPPCGDQRQLKEADDLHRLLWRFDYAILFMQDGFVTFPSGPTNPYNLPIASEEVLKRGALASDRFLDWQKSSNYVMKAA